MNTAKKPAINLTCSYCGNLSFKTVVRSKLPSYFCQSCKRKYARPINEGSGKIAGPVYYRTQEP